MAAPGSSRPATPDSDRPLPREPAAAPTPESALRRELYFFGLYRVLEAGLLALILFSPAGVLVEAPRNLVLGRSVAVAYLLAALVLFLKGRRGALDTQALVGIAVDICAAALAMHALPDSSSGIALMLLFNVGAAALFVPLRYALGAATLAAVALVGEYLWTVLFEGASARPLAELLMFAVSFLAMATVTNLVGRQMRASQALAERRGMEAANLAEISELIIRRMRTGVLLVGHDNLIRVANEAAVLLLGDHEGDRHLDLVAPELARRLHRWRRDGTLDETPLQLAPDLPEVLPRFTRLMADSEQALVFLDDTSSLSRRAESMTLATLGRFSASLAHEIRNPLAAISYSTQLLEESRLPDADRRLLQIIHQQTQRMNGIVENVLSLARRERAQPDHVELVGFARRFVEEYGNSHPLDGDVLQVASKVAEVPALVDQRHLHQVLTALVHNALTYGRMPGEPARVTLVIGDAHGPQLDVLDRGPGIPDGIAGQLFRPFFTTSGHGTGLGLYIARELCRANQATLEFVAIPGGGGCFRIRFPGPHSLLPA